MDLLSAQCLYHPIHAEALTAHSFRAPGWFTPVAEITNGRAAMLAFGVLLFLEYKSRVPLF